MLSFRWYKVPDPQGNGDYYVDAISCHTQWDQPSNYDESLEESAIATAAARVGGMSVCVSGFSPYCLGLCIVLHRRRINYTTSGDVRWVWVSDMCPQHVY